MSDDMDQSEAQPRNVPQSVTIYLVGQEAKIVQLDGLETFKDISDALVSQGVDMDNKVLVDDQDNVKDNDAPLHENVPEAGLAVKTQITVFVIHDNMEWSVPVLLNSKMTVQTVKNAVMSQDVHVHFRGTTMTWQGQVVEDDLRTDLLPDILQLANGSDHLSEEQRRPLRFTGRKYISIMDIDVGESSIVELTEVSDNMTVRDVLQIYQARERRGYLHMPLLSVFIEGETNADSIQVQPNLTLEASLYASGINNGDILALKTGMFEVTIKESSEIEAAVQRNKGVGQHQQRSAADEVVGIRVHVFDWWKVRQLKDAYSALVTEGLSANDQLYLDSIGGGGGGPTFNDELSEDKTLYYYQIRDTSTLLVKREDFTTTHCYYICADCGNDVKLKPKDGVRCRDCGHRIVFKRRIAKPCQYLCR